MVGHSSAMMLDGTTSNWESKVSKRTWLAASFCQAETRLELAGGHRDGEAVRNVVGCRQLRTAEGRHFAPRGQRVDHGDLDPDRAELPGDRRAEAAQPGDDPPTRRRPVGRGQILSGQGGDQLDQPQSVGGRHGQGEVLGELLDGVDDVVGAEQGHGGRGDRAGGPV